jgi:hypothetical protein
VIAATLDPDGIRVVLDERAWAHIQRRHPILRRYVGEIMNAVRAPAVRLPGRTAREVWYLAEDAGRFPWLQVVVHYERGSGWIVTAFPRSKPPRR